MIQWNDETIAVCGDVNLSFIALSVVVEYSHNVSTRNVVTMNVQMWYKHAASFPLTARSLGVAAVGRMGNPKAKSISGMQSAYCLVVRRFSMRDYLTVFQ